MAKKIGEVLIAIVILTFVVAAFSSFINEADAGEGVSSGEVKLRLRNMSTTAENNPVQDEFQASIDNTTDLEADPNQQLEKRGDSAAGILNILSKNVIGKFLIVASSGLTGFEKVFILLGTLVGIIITIVLIRFWKGETKV